MKPSEAVKEILRELVCTTYDAVALEQISNIRDNMQLDEHKELIIIKDVDKKEQEKNLKLVMDLDKQFIDREEYNKKVLEIINKDIFNMLDINMRDKISRATTKSEINWIITEYLKELKDNKKIVGRF